MKKIDKKFGGILAKLEKTHSKDQVKGGLLHFLKYHEGTQRINKKPNALQNLLHNSLNRDFDKPKTKTKKGGATRIINKNPNLATFNLKIGFDKDKKPVVLESKKGGNLSEEDMLRLIGKMKINDDGSLQYNPNKLALRDIRYEDQVELAKDKIELEENKIREDMSKLNQTRNEMTYQHFVKANEAYLYKNNYVGTTAVDDTKKGELYEYYILEPLSLLNKSHPITDYTFTTFKFYIRYNNVLNVTFFYLTTDKEINQGMMNQFSMLQSTMNVSDRWGKTFSVPTEIYNFLNRHGFVFPLKNADLFAFKYDKKKKNVYTTMKVVERDSVNILSSQNSKIFLTVSNDLINTIPHKIETKVEEVKPKAPKLTPYKKLIDENRELYLTKGVIGTTSPASPSKTNVVEYYVNVILFDDKTANMDSDVGVYTKNNIFDISGGDKLIIGFAVLKDELEKHKEYMKRIRSEFTNLSNTDSKTKYISEEMMKLLKDIGFIKKKQNKTFIAPNLSQIKTKYWITSKTTDIMKNRSNSNVYVKVEE